MGLTLSPIVRFQQGGVAHGGCAAPAARLVCVRRAAVAGIRPAARLDYRPGARPDRPGAARRDGGGHQHRRPGSPARRSPPRPAPTRSPNLEPGTYDVTVTMAGFGTATRPGLLLAPGSAVALDLKMQVAGVQENLVVTGESPLVERTSNQIGGSLSRREIEEVPVELPQLHRPDPADSRDDAQPGHLDVRGRPGGGQRVAVAAERLPARRDVQQRRPPRRQPGHAGARRPRQHRGIPGAGQPVQLRVRRRRRRDHQHGDPRRHQRLPRPRLLLLPRRDAQRPRQVPARRPAQAARAHPAGRLRRRRPDRPEPRPLLLHLRARQRGHRRPEELPARGGAAGGEPGRRVHRARQQLLRPRRPAAERPQLHQRALAARGRRRRAARASTPTTRPPTPRSGRPTTTRCGPAPTPACSPTGCRASPASAASASR